MKPQPARVSAILTYKGKIAVEKKGDKYVLLGGKMEKGETVLTSAKREIKEELGILLSKLRYISSWRISGREIHFVKGNLSGGLFGKIRLEKKLKMAWVNKRVFFENALFPCPEKIKSEIYGVA